MPCTVLVCSDLDYLRISGSSDKRVQCACTHSGTVQSILGFRDTMTGGYSVHVLSQDGQSISEYSNKGYSVHVLVFISVLSHDAVSDYLGNTEYSYKGCSLHVLIPVPSRDLGILWQEGALHVFILVLSRYSQSILGSQCTLIMGVVWTVSWQFPWMVRVSQYLIHWQEGMVWFAHWLVPVLSWDSQSILGVMSWYGTTHILA